MIKRTKSAVLVGVAALALAGMGTGIAFAQGSNASSAAALLSLSSPPAAVAPWALPVAQPPSSPSAGVAPWAPRRGGHPPASQTNSPTADSSSPSSVPPEPSALADEVDPAVVDINTVLSNPNDQAAGTGIVLDPSGVVLTNNHVISGATSITVTETGNNQTYPATVLGYDQTHDIAVLQLQNASGLPTAEIGDSGDSGGPLVNSTGQVIGIDTAGSSGSRWRSNASGGDGLAIPINDAIAISEQIQAGAASSTIHIGPTGIMGITVQAPNAQREATQRGRLRNRHHVAIPAVTGAVVTGITADSPAAQSGLTAGDIIVSLDATPVDSPTTLTTLVTAHHPGDSVNVTWIDPAGQQHTATMQLAAGPPN